MVNYLLEEEGEEEEYVPDVGGFASRLRQYRECIRRSCKGSRHL